MQPSEFAKFGTAMALAKYFDTPNMRFITRREHLITYSIIRIPLLLVAAQETQVLVSYLRPSFSFLNREGLSDLVVYLGLFVIAVSVLSLIINQYIIIGITIVVFSALI
ncbi:MAG: hypothetical protein IPM95_10790, partial [Sphingobacteriales bacterium]|nr:hypothetical protein [Sphingobacteriales bacterium]